VKNYQIVEGGNGYNLISPEKSIVIRECKSIRRIKKICKYFGIRPEIKVKNLKLIEMG